MVIRYYKKKEALIVIQENKANTDAKLKKAAENVEDQMAAMNQVETEGEVSKLDDLFKQNMLLKRLRFLKIFVRISNHLKEDVK